MTAPPPGEASVTITLRDIYDKVVSVEGSVQTMQAPIQAIADHETRIRSLEKWRYSQPASLVLALASLVLAARSHL